MGIKESGAAGEMVQREGSWGDGAERGEAGEMAQREGRLGR